jgi:hypothetical protein
VACSSLPLVGVPLPGVRRALALVRDPVPVVRDLLKGVRGCLLLLRVVPSGLY